MYDRTAKLGTGPPVGCGGLGGPEVPQMMIDLHDANNPDRVVYIDPKTIAAIYTVDGTRTVVCLSAGHVLMVSESPDEVYRKREQQ